MTQTRRLMASCWACLVCGGLALSGPPLAQGQARPTGTAQAKGQDATRPRVPAKPPAGRAPKPTPPSRRAAAASVPKAPLADEAFVALLRRPPAAAVAVRRLDAGSRKLNANAWLQARTVSDASGLRYEVLDSGGSGRILKNVLQPVLDAEVEHSRAQASWRSAITSDNYTFRVERQPARVLVHLAAKRADIRLLNGVAAFAPDGTLLRIEGRLADRPSFWVKSVTIVREYGQVAGVVVPRSVESVAEVRLAGLSRFLMTFHYERLNGRVVPGALASAATHRFTPDPSSHILALHLTSP